MPDLIVSLVQAPLQWQAPEANRRRLGDLVRQAEAGSDLVLLPEMFTTGFTMAMDHAEPMHGPTVDWMVSLARERNVTLCGSLVIEDGGHHFNRLLWVTPEGLAGHYDKRHLFRMAGEHEHFTPGQTRQVFNLGGWRVCPLICYDLRFPVWSRGVNEFDLLIYVANWPAARRTSWRALLPARAVENQCYVAGVNRLGFDGKAIEYVGESAVYDPIGATRLECGQRERVATVRLDRASLDTHRDRFPAWLDADRFTLLP